MAKRARPHIRAVLFIPLFAAVLFAFSETEKSPSYLKGPAVVKALSTLEKKEYGMELGWWASDQRGGREPGTSGSIEAGESAAKEFKRLRLKAIGDPLQGRPSYFQHFEKGGKSGLLQGYRFAINQKTYSLEREWSLLGGCSEVNLENAEVVFAGYGISAPEYEYDDYEGIDAQGKAVLILRYEPQEKDLDSKWKGTENTKHSYFQTKVENAEKHGAVAVLMVNGPRHHDPDHDPLCRLSTVAKHNSKIPLVHVRKVIADSLLRRTGRTLSAVQEKMDREGKPMSFHLSGARMDFVGKVGVISKARNVMGLLEGSDPRLKDQVVVVGAHYDHVGMGEYGSRTPNRMGEVHNGADDNASGSVGVLELAEAFVQGGLRTRRSILFQLYDGEEKGLLGSRHFVDHPLVSLERIVAMINMDMIGHVRDKKCAIMGTETAEEWEEILSEAEVDSPLTWTHRGGAMGGSDQASFLMKNIPVLFFHSGVHSIYHTPDDDAEKCNAEGAVEVLKVVLKTLLLAANRDDPLTFKKPSPPAGPPAKLGISVQALEEGRPGLKITGLAAGGGAEKAGLRAGDILLGIDGSSVNGLTDLMSILEKRKPGEMVKVKYLRDDQESEIEVSLGS